MTDLITRKPRFTFEIAKKINDQNILTLFAPPAAYLKDVAYFRAVLNDAVMKSILSMQELSSKKDEKKKLDKKDENTEIDETSLEVMVRTALYSLGEIYADYLERFREFLARDGICFPGDYGSADTENIKNVTVASLATHVQTEEMEDLAVTYSTKFFLSKKLIAS